MKGRVLGFALVGVLGLLASAAHAGVIFSDDFEYDSQAAFEAVWPKDPAMTPADLSTEQAHSGSKSIKTTNAASNQNTNYRNLGGDLVPTDTAPIVATFWLYDVPGATRQFNSLRNYAGAGYKDGSVNQIYAAGIYNSVTAAGEVYDATTYKARVAFGAGGGWINLNAPGAPTRSEGWHKFTIVVKDATIDFWVDGFLGRSWTRGDKTALDSVALGSSLSSLSGTPATAKAAYTDDFSVSVVPEPASMALLALGGLFLRRRRVA